MRPNGKHLDPYRKRHPLMGDSPPGQLFGFFVARKFEANLAIISSGESHDDPLGKWEHVSVSLYHGKGLPTWEQMQWVKDQFWRRDETVIQFHPADSQYVNVAEVLHLWKPPYDLPLPPTLTLAPQVTGR
jgi:hypothetical protein